MSQYFTFDGTTFHNKDAFKTLTIKENEKKTNSKLYFFITVLDQDGSVIFESDNYKVEEDRINIERSDQMYHDKRQKILDVISSL